MADKKGVVRPTSRCGGSWVTEPPSPPSAADTLLEELQDAIQSNVLAFGVAAALVLQGAFAQAAVADHDAVRDADQLHVGELHAGAGLLVAIVQQHFVTGG